MVSGTRTNVVLPRHALPVKGRAAGRVRGLVIGGWTRPGKKRQNLGRTPKACPPAEKLSIAESVLSAGRQTVSTGNFEITTTESAGGDSKEYS